MTLRSFKFSLKFGTLLPPFTLMSPDSITRKPLREVTALVLEKAYPACKLRADSVSLRGCPMRL